MIFDSKENLMKYASKSKNFETAVKWYLSTDLDALEPGRYEIDGTEVYAMVQCYDTKPRSECNMELHNNYTDFQYIHEGTEYMGYVPRELCEIRVPYMPEKDMTFCHELPIESSLCVTAGHYCIFEPDDGHVSQIMDGEPKPVKKVLLKVKMN